MSITWLDDGDPVKVGRPSATSGLGCSRLSPSSPVSTNGNERPTIRSWGKFDVGLFDATVSMMNEYVTFHSMTGEMPGPQGRTHQSICPYQMFETADGRVVMGVPSDERWDDFVALLGRDELREYETTDQRMANRETVTDIIQEEFEQKSTGYWLKKLTEHGFPNGPLNDLSNVVAHEQSRARNFTVQYDDPDASTVQWPGHPVHFPEFSPGIRVQLRDLMSTPKQCSGRWPTIR